MYVSKLTCKRYKPIKFIAGNWISSQPSPVLDIFDIMFTMLPMFIGKIILIYATPNAA